MLSLPMLPGYINLPASPVVSLTFCPTTCLCFESLSSTPLMSTSYIHYRMALAQYALSPSVVLNYSVFLGQALVSSYFNDFLIICLYVMNEMEMYHHSQTGVGAGPSCHTKVVTYGSRVESLTWQINIWLYYRSNCILFIYFFCSGSESKRSFLWCNVEKNSLRDPAINNQSSRTDEIKIAQAKSLSGIKSI